jgi:hypothetical protein
VKRVIIDLPDDVAKLAKIHAVKCDKSLRELITDIIYEIVARETGYTVEQCKNLNLVEVENVLRTY